MNPDSGSKCCAILRNCGSWKSALALPPNWSACSMRQTNSWQSLSLREKQPADGKLRMPSFANFERRKCDCRIRETSDAFAPFASLRHSKLDVRTLPQSTRLGRRTISFVVAFTTKESVCPRLTSIMPRHVSNRCLGRATVTWCGPGLRYASKTCPLVNAPAFLPSIRTASGILIPRAGECLSRMLPPSARPLAKTSSL